MKRIQIRKAVAYLAVMSLSLGAWAGTASAAAINQKMEQPLWKDQGRPYYRIKAKYDDRKGTVHGHLSVELPKQRTEPVRELYFRLYPNAFKKWKWGEASKPKEPGYLKVGKVKVNDVPAHHTVKETVMKVGLSTPSLPGQPLKVDMEYELKIPKGGSRLNTFGHTAFLAQWYPMLAVKDRDGWHTEPYTATGDPFYSQMANFEVTFEVPEGYQLITTADDRAVPAKGPITLRQAHVRDFAAVITKDYEVVEGKAGSTQVNLWYLKGMEGIAQELHAAAVSGMQFYGKHFGPYPYKEVDVVLGETGYGIAGMEYPGLVTSVDKIPTRKGEQPAVSVVVHELAHQWWYGVVGNNQVKEPWLDEGLTTFSELLYMHDKMKEDERDLLLRAAQRTDEIHQEQGVTSVEPLYKYSDPIYGLMVYIRPAAMLWNLSEKIGKDKVLDILSTYYKRYQFKTATTADFIKVANEVSGKNLRPFFDKWLYFKGTSGKKQTSGNQR
ncbi:peptidase [Marinithermofilum abyssi]|uniref:Peptidase n=1 Tax=Marinithermofilum abyssi TaxID=1571185 RepID=A0A8J2VIB1_9BACL|nr:M1 family metallopeptidase [Marinithermofilum abyssi]GGE14805.1 peptidase [Marinithermofilum abyssi]